jgi:hypothetical protein
MLLVTNLEVRSIISVNVSRVDSDMVAPPNSFVKNSFTEFIWPFVGGVWDC